MKYFVGIRVFHSLSFVILTDIIPFYCSILFLYLKANSSKFFFKCKMLKSFTEFAGGGSTSLASSPVMVLVHGESYSWGAWHLMDGAMLAGKSRMVVVTLNYRLGILGTIKHPLNVTHDSPY